MLAVCSHSFSTKSYVMFSSSLSSLALGVDCLRRLREDGADGCVFCPRCNLSTEHGSTSDSSRQTGVAYLLLSLVALIASSSSTARGVARGLPGGDAEQWR